MDTVLSLFDTGIRPVIDKHLAEEAAKVRDYGNYWSASSAGYCMRKLMFERLKIPYTSEDARKQRVFSSGHIFHDWMQGITKASGLSIAQELELQDEELMIRGHIDDLVLVGESLEFQTDWDNIYNKNLKVNEDGTISPIDPKKPSSFTTKSTQHLILYDYKTAHSRSFHYAKDKPMSYFHKMQVGTYMYMLNSKIHVFDNPKERFEFPRGSFTEARVLKISKDDLCMMEHQLLWSLELEQEVLNYWTTLNKYWNDKQLPKCTCGDQENGFMAKEAYNPFFYQGEPCSLAWYELNKVKENQGAEN